MSSSKNKAKIVVTLEVDISACDKKELITNNVFNVADYLIESMIDVGETKSIVFDRVKSSTAVKK